MHVGYCPVITLIASVIDGLLDLKVTSQVRAHSRVTQSCEKCRGVLLQVYLPVTFFFKYAPIASQIRIFAL